MKHLAAALVGVLILAGPAGAAEKDSSLRLPPDKPKSATTDGLRGAAGTPRTAYGASALAKPTVTAPTKPYVALGRARDTRLMSPGLIEPAAPRLKPWSQGASGGGSQCRTTCATDQYICLSQDGGDCTTTWSKCVAGCPEQSAGDL